MPASVKIKYRTAEDGEGPFLRLMNPGEEGGRGKRVPIPTNEPESILKFATTLFNFAGVEVESNLERDKEEEIDDRVRASARDAAARDEEKAREREARERERKNQAQLDAENQVQAEKEARKRKDEVETETETRRAARARAEEEDAGNEPESGRKSEPGRSAQELGVRPGVPLQTSGGSVQTKQAGTPVPPAPKPNVPKK